MLQGPTGTTSKTRVNAGLQNPVAGKPAHETILHASPIMPWRFCRCAMNFGMLLCLTAINGQESTDAVPSLFSKWLNEQGVDTSAFTVRKKHGEAGYGAFAIRTAAAWIP